MSNDNPSADGGHAPQSMSELEDAVKKEASYLLADVQRMVVLDDMCFIDLMSIHERLTNLITLYCTKWGMDQGHTVDVRIIEQQEYMERKKRRIFDDPVATNPDSSARILARELNSKAWALGEIIYLEKEIATLKSRKEADE